MSDDDVRYVIEHREFATEIRTTAPHTAIVLTQSWCHQWHAMRAWMGHAMPARTGHAMPARTGHAMPARTKGGEKSGVTIWYYEYDTTDLFDPFREFKEHHWQNDQVPYVRYYRDGVCVQQSNYCSEADFYRSFDA